MFAPKPIFTIVVASDRFDADLRAMTQGASGVYVTFKPERQFEALAIINQIKTTSAFPSGFEMAIRSSSELK